MKEKATENKEGFDPFWLDERYQYDVLARNPNAEAKCLQSFQHLQEIFICDVGSGSGSNLIYFMGKFPSHQHWFLVEQDEQLNHYAFKRVGEWVKNKGYTFVKYQYPTIHLQNSEQNIYIQFLTGSLLRLDQLLDLGQIQLVTAGAVFDLFSVDQFHTFAKLLLEHQCNLLTTLNYKSMSFSPKGKNDEKYIALYEAHMQRQQAFGCGMGKDCSQEMIAFYQDKTAVEVTFGESLWSLNPQAQLMHQYLLAFMEESVGSMLTTNEEQVNFKTWLVQKGQLSQSGKLNIHVNHMDLFIAING